MCLPSVQEGQAWWETMRKRDIFTVYEGKGGGRPRIYHQTSAIIYQTALSNICVHAVAKCHPELGWQAKDRQWWCLLHNARSKGGVLRGDNHIRNSCQHFNSPCWFNTQKQRILSPHISRSLLLLMQAVRKFEKCLVVEWDNVGGERGEFGVASALLPTLSQPHSLTEKKWCSDVLIWVFSYNRQGCTGDGVIKEGKTGNNNRENNAFSSRQC